MNDTAWIHVDERLPEAFKPVLLCRNTPDGYKVEQGMRDVGGWWKVYGTKVKKVDWWMPLPQPPGR